MTAGVVNRALVAIGIAAAACGGLCVPAGAEPSQGHAQQDNQKDQQKAQKRSQQDQAKAHGGSLPVWTAPQGHGSGNGDECPLCKSIQGISQYGGGATAV